MKWLLVLFVTVFVAGISQPRLAALLKFGRLPGDLRIRVNGRNYCFPFASSLLLSLLATLLLRLL